MCTAQQQQRANSCPSFFRNNSNININGGPNYNWNLNSYNTITDDHDEIAGFDFGGGGGGGGGDLSTALDDIHNNHHHHHRRLVGFGREELSLLHSAILDHDDRLNREVDELFQFPPAAVRREQQQ